MTMSRVVEPTPVWAPPTDQPLGLYEFVDGVWQEVPRMGAMASFLAAILVHELNAFARGKLLGLAMGETLFRLNPKGPARRPDVAFVSKQRWTYTGPIEDDPPAFDIVPNLAIEVISPTNTAEELPGKVHDYFFHGVELIWVVYPRHRLVYVHEDPEHIRVLSEKHELDGGSVLPGFKLSLAALFAANRLT